MITGGKKETSNLCLYGGEDYGEKEKRLIMVVEGLGPHGNAEGFIQTPQGPVTFRKESKG